MTVLNGKVAIVTGASGGIGSALVKKLADAGASVLAADIDEASLQGAVAAIGSGLVTPHAVDIADPDSVSSLFHTAMDMHGRLDISMLNAGLFGQMVEIEDYDPEVFRRVMDVNVIGTWNCLRQSFSAMRKSGGGSVVVTASIQGISAVPNSCAYTMSKHALVGMVKGAALEGAQYNIRVNSIAPGLTDTLMMEDVHQRLSGEQTADEVMGAWAQTIPLQKYAQPSQIAEMGLFLASPCSSYCTGSNYVVDGGLTASWMNPG